MAVLLRCHPAPFYNCLPNWRETSQRALTYNNIGTKVEQLTDPYGTRRQGVKSRAPEGLRQAGLPK